MTGEPNWNREAFNDAARQLREAGYDVVNPADSGFGRRAWSYYMRLGLRGLLDCDAVALLPGWSHSRGATLEEHIAQELGMSVKYVETWVDEAV